MPQLKNAEKALRQSQKRQEVNTAIKANLHYLIHEAKKLAEAKDAKAGEALKAAIKALDKAAQKGTLKLNKVSRDKSRLTQLVKKLHVKEVKEKPVKATKAKAKAKKTTVKPAEKKA